jgi:hypothetical protein
MTEDEMFAGLKFLLRYAPREYLAALEAAIEACRTVQSSSAIDRLRADSVDALDLSVRSANALEGMGLKTVSAVEAFAALPDVVVLERGKKNYFSKKCLKEVREALADVGLKVVPNVTDARGGFIDSRGEVNKSGRVG